MGDGANGRPERRLGYRPPPGSLSLRILILCLTAVVAAVLLKAVVDLIVAYAGQAGEIGRATQRTQPGAAAAGP